MIHDTLLLCGLNCLLKTKPFPSHNLISSPDEAKQMSAITKQQAIADTFIWKNITKQLSELKFMNPCMNLHVLGPDFLERR